MKTLSGKLTYANVISTICLFLLLGGGAAFAASQLGKNTVGSKQLKKNAITSAKIKNSAVTGAKLKAEAVTNAALAADAVTGAKVKDGSLTGADIDQASLTGVRASNVYGLAFQGDKDCTPARPLPAGFSSERKSEGFCRVNFPFSAANCVINANFSVRDVADNFITTIGNRSIQIVQHTSEPNTVVVETEFKEVRNNSPFDMIAVC